MYIYGVFNELIVYTWNKNEKNIWVLLVLLTYWHSQKKSLVADENRSLSGNTTHKDNIW